MPNPAGCPNSTEAGCKCPEHHPGLALYAQDPIAYEKALRRIRDTKRPARLTAVPTDPCAGGMTCPCPACTTQREQRVKRGPRDTAQPWTPRPPRHQRAA